jgi:hypothetical protein
MLLIPSFRINALFLPLFIVSPLSFIFYQYFSLKFP